MSVSNPRFTIAQLKDMVAKVGQVDVKDLSNLTYSETMDMLQFAIDNVAAPAAPVAPVARVDSIEHLLDLMQSAPAAPPVAPAAPVAPVAPAAPAAPVVKASSRMDASDKPNAWAAWYEREKDGKVTRQLYLYVKQVQVGTVWNDVHAIDYMRAFGLERKPFHPYQHVSVYLVKENEHTARLLEHLSVAIPAAPAAPAAPVAKTFSPDDVRAMLAQYGFQPVAQG